jgi:predicted dinucleotide-binding enzyme
MKGASGPGPKPARGQTAAAFNAGRMPGARYTKSFNTLTSRFQAEAAGRTGEKRVVQWICGHDPRAKTLVAKLIEDIGYVPARCLGRFVRYLRTFSPWHEPRDAGRLPRTAGR